MNITTDKRKTVKTVIRITLIVIVAVIIGTNIYSINASQLLGDPIPMPLGIGAAVIMSGSMEDELSVGDLVFVVAGKEYQVGEVVVYITDGIAVTHRIVSIDGETVVTKGDANNTEDFPINISQIRGKVVFSLPLIGFAVNTIKTPIGTICIMLLAALLLESSFHSDKEKDDKKLDAIRDEIEKLKQEQEK